MLKVKVGNENISFMALNLLGHNNYCSVGVMELCFLNLLILTDWFLCNSYHFVLFESLSHVINQESHVYSWNLVFSCEFCEIFKNTFLTEHLATAF